MIFLFEILGFLINKHTPQLLKSFRTKRGEKTMVYFINEHVCSYLITVQIVYYRQRVHCFSYHCA